MLEKIERISVKNFRTTSEEIKDKREVKKRKKTTDIPFEESPLHIEQATGKEVIDLWAIIRNMEIIHGKSCRVSRILAIPMVHEMILGRDLMFKLGIAIDGLIVHEVSMDDEDNVPAIKPKKVEEGDKYDKETTDKIVEGIEGSLKENIVATKDKYFTLEEAVIEIDTEEPQPIYTKQYPIALKHKELMKKYIDEMIKKGVIQEHQGSWERNSPMISAFKKPYLKEPNVIKRRHCLDFRRINAETKPYRYPQPTVHEILNTVSTFKYYSLIDLADAYHTCPIRVEDRKKTVFTFNGTRYQYNRAFFGLKNMPMKFTRVMHRIPKFGKFCRFYIDDIIIFSNTREEHIDHLNQIIKALTENGLMVRSEN